MGKFVAVRMIHDVRSRKTYNLFAEFFRCFGFFVGEGVVDEYSVADEERDRSCFQIFLCIAREPESFRKSNMVLEKMEQWIDIPADEFESNADVVEMKQCFEKKLEEIGNRAEQDGVAFPLDFLKNMIPVVWEYHLVEASCQLQYYRMKHEIHQDTERKFLHVLQFLEGFDGKEWATEEQYWRYAKLFCKQKINLARYLQDGAMLKYPIYDLVLECTALINQYTDFANAWVLMGMICEKSHNDTKRAIAAYQKAISMVGQECYSSHIYYWLGNLYELYAKSHEMAKKTYLCAYVQKKKYRNIYKLARMAAEDRDYEAEFNYYEECLDSLEKRRGKLMDPLEIEYYYKTGVLACHNLVFKQRKYAEARDYGERMQKFYREQLADEASADDFEKLFGEEASKYKRISRDRIRLKKLYECLAVAYRGLGDEHRSLEYWKKVDEQ